MQQTVTTDALPLDDFYTIEDFAAAYPKTAALHTLRWQLRFRKENGLDQCVVRVGKKLLISKSRYANWLQSRMGRST